MHEYHCEKTILRPRRWLMTPRRSHARGASFRPAMSRLSLPLVHCRSVACLAINMKCTDHLGVLVLAKTSSGVLHGSLRGRKMLLLSHFAVPSGLRMLTRKPRCQGAQERTGRTQCPHRVSGSDRLGQSRRVRLDPVRLDPVRLAPRRAIAPRRALRARRAPGQVARASEGRRASGATCARRCGSG